MRKSGILMPISSLPSKYGIGAFSKEAYDFVDLLKETNQSLWQILPLGPTSYGDSPYQSISTFAGNLYFIDLEELIEEGLLTEKECTSCDWGDNEEYIDYGKIYSYRFKILRQAYKRSTLENDTDYIKFCKENEYWLKDYALYIAIKNSNESKSWTNWDEDIRLRKVDAINFYEESLKEDIEFYKYTQYLFFKQWNKLKAYANENGISIVGDIPIYVSLDSADSWSNPELFQLDKDGYPTAVAGCPPDYFSEDGQLWGNPLYDWDYHKESNYEWWIKRIEHAFKLYDVVRIDHFRAFDEYYSIPYGDKNARKGSWKKGPGMDLFNAIKESLGEVNIIAEDLGTITDSVQKLLKDTNYPGMKVLQFAFDTDGSNEYLPHNYERNYVVYTGTHDNQTLCGWYESLDDSIKEAVNTYINNTDESKARWDLICLAMRSIADTCIIPVQDYLGLGDEARMNEPST
ncbi:MAG: 4-alpha-glucanotransferase, partial [Peptostreptococcaceae bacterium]|nr:4-alpha-glucanotransferase [Peptostreptococcaceae bacterium]